MSDESTESIQTQEQFGRESGLPEFTKPESLEQAKTQITQLGRNMNEHAYKVGKILIWVKEEVKHGDFLSWIKENVWFGENTARRYMSFAKECDAKGGLLDYTEYTKSVKLNDLVDSDAEMPKTDGGIEEETSSTPKSLPVRRPINHSVEQMPEKSHSKCARNVELIQEGAGYKGYGEIKIHHGDFREVGKQISDGSVNAVFTDPPWGKDWLPYWDDLGRLAKRVLVDGGFLFTYCGKLYLPQVLSDISKHLEFYWPFAAIFDKTFLTQGRHVWSGYNMIVSFFKPPLQESPNWVKDVVESTREKDFHKCQQSEAPFSYLIETFTRPGDLILDPCAGGGTTLVVCKKLRRNCIAIELKEEAVQIIKGRLAELREGELEKEAA